MIEKAHKQYHAGNLTDRDYLAAHRTILSTKRTLLAYIRTALTLFIAGVTFIRFFQSDVLTIVGWIFVPAGGVITIVGILDYYKIRRMIHSMKYDDEKITHI